MTTITSGPLDPDLGTPEPTELDPAPQRLVGLALLAGFVLEVGLRGGVTNAVVAAGLFIVVAILVTDQRIHRREARLLALAALVPAGFLAIRASPWLAMSNIVASSGLTIAAVLYGRTGSIFDTSPRRALQRGAGALVRGVTGFAVLRVVAPRLHPQHADRLARVGKAILVAVPMLAVVVALLASADAVFASLLTPDLDAVPLLGHLLLTLVVGAVVLCLGAAANAPGTDRSRPGAFGVTEVVTMLALAAGVLGLFVAAQLVALTDAGRRLIESAGLTPAEYARTGFFQLCWATGLLLAFLGVARSLATSEACGHRSVRWLGAVVPLLALGLVVVSLRRMALYDDAFGLTMLRLWVIGAASWMALVLVMTAARSLGFGADRHWLAAGAGLTAVALVVMADLANPEAFVVRHNVSRAADGAELDIDYLRQLSDDAVPAVAAAVDAANDGAVRERLVAALRCPTGPTGVATLNVAVARATDARDQRCG